MSPLQKAVIRRTMSALLTISAALAMHPALDGASFAWSRLLAALATRTKRIGPATGLPALGAAWQRGFASPKQVPVTAVTADTVLARIDTPCPLRGTGRTAACWRMMEYDRAVAAAAGGQFVVLESQAEPGVTACRVALRLAGQPMDDLVPAHIRAPEAGLRGRALRS